MLYTVETFARAVADVLSRDPDLAKEFNKRTTRGEIAAGAERLMAGLESVTDDPGTLSVQAYAYSVVRPVVNVQRHNLQTVKCDAESKIWKKRLTAAGGHLLRAIEATGRIEVKGSGDTKVAGTGFMIRDDVIATNQHVGDQFAKKSADGNFVFRLNLGGDRMEATIDFLEEIGVDESLEFQIVEVLHLEMDVDPDLAFLRVVPNKEGTPLPRPLEFFTGEIEPNHEVAAIGYPKAEIRDPATTALINETFGNVFDKKRVSPGQICAIEDGFVVHDCSVLTGNSGSPIICLNTGRVVGIHAEGEFLQRRVAVPSAAVKATLTMSLARVRTEPPAPDSDGAPGTAYTRAFVTRTRPSRRPSRVNARGERSRKRRA